MKGRNSPNKGFSMLELLLAIGIIAALIVTAFIVYPKIQSSQRAETEAKNISIIIAGVKGLYAAKHNFQGLTNTVIINAGIVPSTMRPKGTTATITNQFKGSVRVYSSDYGVSKTSDSSFTIIYDNVPAEECTKILTSVTGDMGGVSINSNRVKEVGEVLDRESVVKYCSEGGQHNSLNMTSY